jgi:hypothetical protein
VRRLPDWLPGSGFKRTAEHFWSTLQQFAGDPFQFTKKQMVYTFWPQRNYLLLILSQEADTAVPSFVSQQLENVDPKQQAELDIIKWAGASMVAGNVTCNSTWYLQLLN